MTCDTERPRGIVPSDVFPRERGFLTVRDHLEESLITNWITSRDRTPRFLRGTRGGRLARRWCRGQRGHQIRFTVRTNCPNTSVAQADGIEDCAARMIRVLYGGGRNRFRSSLRRRILSRPLDGALLRRERNVHESENDNPAEQPEDNAERQRAMVPRREEGAVRRPRHIVTGHRHSTPFHLTLNLIARVRPA